MWRHLVNNKTQELSCIFPLSFEDMKELHSCFHIVVFVTVFSALVRVLKSLSVKVIPREWCRQWLCPQWEWLHYFSFSLTTKQEYIIVNGRYLFQQGELFHTLGYPEGIFSIIWVIVFLCMQCREGLFESTWEIRFPS